LKTQAGKFFCPPEFLPFFILIAPPPVILKREALKNLFLSWRPPALFLGSPFHANRAPEKVLLAKVFWEEEKTRSAFTVCALRKQCEA